MSKVKEVVAFLVGLILIIGGFLSFILTVVTAKLWGIDLARHNILVALGCILIFLGSIFMYFFVKLDAKKKKGKKKKEDNDKSSIEVA
jgi:hypothetical protein